MAYLLSSQPLGDLLASGHATVASLPLAEPSAAARGACLDLLALGAAGDALPLPAEAELHSPHPARRLAAACRDQPKAAPPRLFTAFSATRLLLGPCSREIEVIHMAPRGTRGRGTRTPPRSSCCWEATKGKHERTYSKVPWHRSHVACLKLSRSLDVASLIATDAGT